MNADLDPIMESAQHAQRIAHKVGASALAVEVWGWAIKHGARLPKPVLDELFDLLTQEDE